MGTSYDRSRFKRTTSIISNADESDFSSIQPDNIPIPLGLPIVYFHDDQSTKNIGGDKTKSTLSNDEENSHFDRRNKSNFLSKLGHRNKKVQDVPTKLNATLNQQLVLKDIQNRRRLSWNDNEPQVQSNGEGVGDLLGVLRRRRLENIEDDDSEESDNEELDDDDWDSWESDVNQSGEDVYGTLDKERSHEDETYYEMVPDETSESEQATPPSVTPAPPAPAPPPPPPPAPPPPCAGLAEQKLLARLQTFCSARYDYVLYCLTASARFQLAARSVALC